MNNDHGPPIPSSASSNAQLSKPLTPPFPHPNGHPSPIDHQACVSLVINSLKEAREKAKQVSSSVPLPEQSTQRPGVTIDLSHQRIAAIPLEVIELIKDEIERLALAHNQLTSFSEEFAGLPRLRYLNLRSNFLREFPSVLTKLPSLEILDVSRNRLRALPQDFGLLLNLKVLSMSKNKINVLPTYIGEMNDLKILKLDHNPIVFPPKEVWDVEETTREAWLENIKRFLRQHAEKSSTLQDTESGSSDEGVGDHDFSSFNPSFPPTPSFEVESIDSNPPTVRGNMTTIRPLRLNGSDQQHSARLTPRSSSRAAAPPRQQNLVPISSNATNTSSPALPGSTFLPSSRPQTPQSAASTLSNVSQTERHRSNSESTAQGNRGRRNGMPPPPRSKASLKPVDEGKPIKHTRGYSHDSVIDTNNASRSPTDTEKRPGQYFRRLSSLPEHKRSSLSSARVGEAARGILYAMSMLQKPVEQYVQSAGDPNGPHQKVERALYNGNAHVGSLVSALEAYEEKEDEFAVQKIIDACHACVAAFRQVLSMLQSSLKELGTGSPADLRYMKTLLLMVYGSYVEIQDSYEILRPLLLAHVVGDAISISEGQVAPAHPAMNIPRVPHNSSSTASVSDSMVSTSQIAVPVPLATPRSADSSFAIPQTPGTQFSTGTSQPSDSGFDQEDALYQKFQAATSAANLTLPQIGGDTNAAAAQNLQPHTTLKLREVSSLCKSGTEAARRLSKTRWDAIQEGDMNERKKFWDETIKFTNLVINIAELIKSVTQEYKFPKQTLAAVGTVVRPTKDLYILMNGSAFRHMAESQSTTQQGSLSPSNGFAFQSMAPQSMPATPLSAALGHAMQATLPQGGFYANGSPNPSVLGLSSRTATLVGSQYPTMTSTASDVGMSFSSSLASGEK